VYVAPPPVYVTPPPVVVAPRPVYVAPPPVIYPAPGPVYYRSYVRYAPAWCPPGHAKHGRCFEHGLRH
jgi:hypothetical protein